MDRPNTRPIRLGELPKALTRSDQSIVDQNGVTYRRTAVDSAVMEVDLTDGSVQLTHPDPAIRKVTLYFTWESPTIADPRTIELPDLDALPQPSVYTISGELPIWGGLRVSGEVGGTRRNLHTVPLVAYPGYSAIFATNPAHDGWNLVVSRSLVTENGFFLVDDEGNQLVDDEGNLLINA